MLIQTSQVTLFITSFYASLLYVMTQNLVEPKQPTTASSNGLCTDKFSKECHCGSIAKPPSTSLFTRVVYPNSSISVEPYDDELPTAYKYLRVYYRCTDEKDVLVGDNMRECSGGNWIGSVPRCAINNLNRTLLKHIQVKDHKVTEKQNTTKTLSKSDKSSPSVFIIYDESWTLGSNGAFEVPSQNQPNGCLRWSLSPNQTWSVNLKNQTKVHYVRIKLHGKKIEDLYLNREIKIELSLKNITLNEPIRDDIDYVAKPLEIKCRETVPKSSQFEIFEQKFSPNYLVLDFLCEIDSNEKIIFDILYPYEYDMNYLYVNTLEIKFQMHNIQEPTGSDETYELKQKIILIFLCELKLYAFSSNCGVPDIPVTTIMQKDYNYFYELNDERKAYKYICIDTNKVIRGNPRVECGNYGMWKSEFPHCVPSKPCEKLTNVTVNREYKMDVKYEMVVKKKNGKSFIPNGKYARFSCTKINETRLKITYKTNSSNSTSTNRYSHKGMSQIICKNGEWIGLQSANPNCITVPKPKIAMANLQTQKANISDVSEEISLPVRVIQILSALFILLCLIIVSLLLYMIKFKKKLNRANSMKANSHFNPFDHDSPIPSITYNTQFNEYSDAIYSSEEDFFHRDNFEPEGDSHVYYTVKLNNYSDSSYSEVKINEFSKIGEERVNSIYGLEDIDFDECDEKHLFSDTHYNELSRVSSVSMIKNSIYESDNKTE